MNKKQKFRHKELKLMVAITSSQKIFNNWLKLCFIMVRKAAEQHCSAHVVASQELRKGKTEVHRNDFFSPRWNCRRWREYRNMQGKRESVLVMHLHVPWNFFYTSVRCSYTHSLSLSPPVASIYSMYFFAELLYIRDEWVESNNNWIYIVCTTLIF